MLLTIYWPFSQPSSLRFNREWEENILLLVPQNGLGLCLFNFLMRGLYHIFPILILHIYYIVFIFFHIFVVPILPLITKLKLTKYV